MANIPPAIPPVDATDIEIAQDKPITESLFNKIASNQSRLIDLSERNIKIISFLTSGSAQMWTVPVTSNYFWILAVGGGGGGQRTIGNGGASGGAGGNGASPELRMMPLFPGGNVTIVTGLGGAGGAAGISSASPTPGANGARGGDTYVHDDTSGNRIYFGGADGGIGGTSNPTPITNAPAGGSNRLSTFWNPLDAREDIVPGYKGSWQNRGGDGGIIGQDSEAGADGWAADYSIGGETGGANGTSGAYAGGAGAGGGGGGGYGGWGSPGKGGTGGSGTGPSGVETGGAGGAYGAGGGGGAGGGSIYAPGAGGQGEGGRVLIFYYDF